MNKKFLKAVFMLTLLFSLMVASAVCSFAKEGSDGFHEIDYNADGSDGFHEIDYNAEVSDGFHEIDYNAESSANALGAESLPASYMTEIMGAEASKAALPSVRIQQPYQVCWAFSLVGNAEINLIRNGYVKKDEVNLSEAQLAYFMYHRVNDPLSNTDGDTFTLKDAQQQATYLNQGGNILSATFMLSGHVGLANESVMPYSEITNDTTYTTSVAQSLAYKNNSYVMENAYYLDTSNVEQIKEAIYKYGSVAAGYLESEGSFNFGNNTYYNNAQTSNHAIDLVGWDDSVSKSYFNNSPAHDGAWIVRNSWGTNRSYFYMSYDQYLSNAISCTYVPASTYSNNYHYDGGSSDTKLTLKPGKSAGNIYKVKGNSTGHELLKSVNVGFASVDANYKISIYKNVPDASEPVNGTLVTSVQGSTSFAGLYTIKLDEPVVLKEGINYSIVVTNASESADMMLFTDKNQYETNLYYKNEVSTWSWQSYSQDRWGFWEDGGSTSPGYTVRIKGFTKNCDHSPSSSDLIPATLNKDGSSGAVSCSDCGESIGEATVIPKIDASSIQVDGDSFVYTGSKFEPSVTVKDRCGDKLISGDDYSLTYENNIKPGTATVNITFKGNYSGSTSCNFTITCPHDNLDDPVVTPATFDKDGSISGRKCRVCASMIGEATVIPKIDASSIQVDGDSFVYTGSKLEPSVTVKDRCGDKLIAGDNYSLTYENNIKPGTATVNITFKGNYSGKTSCDFTITCPHDDLENPLVTPATFDKDGSISGRKCKVCEKTIGEVETIPAANAIISKTSAVYNKKNNAPIITVKTSNSKPLESEYYEIKWNNTPKNAGIYKATITLKGQFYEGTKTFKYSIIPMGTSTSSIKGSKKAFKIKWKSQSTKMSTSRITGYQIQYSKNKTFSGGKTVSVKGYKTTSKTIKKLSSKKKYFVRIRTYFKVSGTTLYSNWSSTKSVKTK